MEKFVLEGVYPALVTPFDETANINEKALRGLIDHVRGKVTGIVSIGSTGESVYMDAAERKRVFDITLDHVGNSMPVIAGTGMGSTKETIELSQYAFEKGADAVIVINPYFQGASDKGQFEHYYQLAKAVQGPIILYNFPGVTDNFLPPQVIEDLADLPNVIGFKDSSANLAYMMEVMDRVKGKLNVVIGHDEVVVPALAAGATGMILATAQIIPDIWMEIYNLMKNGRVKTARALQQKIQKFTRLIVRSGGPLSVKAALKMLGLEMGVPRKPMRMGGALELEVREEIRFELARLGLLELPKTDWTPPKAKLSQMFEDVGLPANELRGKNARLGKGKAGKGKEAIEIALCAGRIEGPVGKAFALQMTHPRHGYEALSSIIEPNLTARPATLIVPTAPQENLRQANMIYGPTQSAIGRAIAQNIEEGIIPATLLEKIVMLAKVSVHPQAADHHTLHLNCIAAMDTAIKSAFAKGF